MLVYNKNAPDGAFLLLYADLCAWVGTAGERAFLDLLEQYGACFCGVDRKVTADVCAWAGNFGATSLAYEDFTCVHFLATKALHA